MSKKYPNLTVLNCVFYLGIYLCMILSDFLFLSRRYKINAFKALTSWIQIGAVTLDNIDKNEVMHEAFSTLGNIQESPTVYESAADW